MYVTNNMIPCPYTHDTKHRWVLASDLDVPDVLHIVCKEEECGYIAYTARAPGLLITQDIDVIMEQGTYAGEATTTIRV